MADNYLEKRMEDYRRGTHPTAHRTAGPRAGRLSMPYPHQYVLVAGADTEAGTAAVEAFVAAGCTVAFTTAGTDSDGRRLAQRLGARYYPGTPADALADMERRGEAIGTVIHTAAPAATVPGACNILITASSQPYDGLLVIAAPTTAAAAAARIALMCAYPGTALPPQLITL